MTNEETINVINTWIEPMRKTLTGTLTHEFLDAVEALKNNCIKYGWHDLRINPNDFPTKDCDLLAVRNNMGIYRQTPVTFSNGCWFDCIFNEVAEDVIAWREIEPFEGV